MSTNVVYHIVPSETFHAIPESQAYVTPDLETTGFIHCTKTCKVLQNVANHFYKDNTSPYLLLVIDEDKLTSPLKYEAPAPVGNIAPTSEAINSSMDFPHIYGPINREAIIRVAGPLPRGTDGSFLPFE
mmetsp:Transcript_33994/g.55072  ORF Transcript_33994/g.55072 Transcript_33994/m.55072 type:complete len:129 (+) Transcript_33994:126-512(+)